MKNFLLIYILLSFLFYGCNKVSDDVLLGGKDHFIIHKPNEDNINPTKELFDRYKLLNKLENDNILPLHKVITADNYKIFIALPIDTPLDLLKQRIFRSEGQNDKAFNNTDGTFIYQSIVSDDISGRKYFISIVSEDSLLIAEFYENDIAKKRIVFNN